MKSRTNIYLEASRMIAEDECTYSCLAICHASLPDLPNPYYESLAVQAYTNVFSEHGLINWDKRLASLGLTKQELVNLRVMMTSLMAVCWKDFQ